jgi:hypothetical protein
MATKTTNRSFLDGDQSPEKLRREFIEKPLNGAKLSALGTGLELFDLLSVLPDAFISSQRRELGRLKAAGKDNDDRVNRLEASIEQATALRTTVKRGESRVQRALGSLGDPELAFHGFVSDANLNPVAGLTVRLSGREGSGKRGLTATTEDDGYFRIPLGSKRDTGKEWRSRVGQISFAEKLNIFTEEQAAATGSGSDATTGKVRGHVEILQGQKSLYTDPAGVPIDEGSVYREYVVQAESRPRSDYGDFASVDVQEVEVAQTASARRAPKKTSKRASKK